MNDFTIEDEDNIPADLQKAIDNNYGIQVKTCIGWIDAEGSELRCGNTYRVVSGE